VTSMAYPLIFSSRVQRELTCHTCGAALFLMRTGIPHYQWQCPKQCLPPLDTEVPTSEQLDDLQPDASDTVEFNATHFFPPMTKSRVATAKVLMAQILYHFIECTWGTCYNSLYFIILVPHLDAPEVLDYVLRSPIVHGSAGLQAGKSGARLYPGLRSRLQGVASPRIHTYLAENFPLGAL
jgi:hypothetical protein